MKFIVSRVPWCTFSFVFLFKEAISSHDVTNSCYKLYIFLYICNLSEYNRTLFLLMLASIIIWDNIKLSFSFILLECLRKLVIYSIHVRILLDRYWIQSQKPDWKLLVQTVFTCTRLTYRVRQHTEIFDSLTPTFRRMCFQPPTDIIVAGARSLL